jgi:hypothetical protein
MILGKTSEICSWLISAGNHMIIAPENPATFDLLKGFRPQFFVIKWRIINNNILKIKYLCNFFPKIQ